MDDQKTKSEIEKKAGILIDALPYIRDFSGKIVTICYSCVNLLSDKEELSLMQDISLLRSIGMKPILVHDHHYGVDRYRENKRIAKLLEGCGNKAVGLAGIDLDALNMSMQNDYIPVVTPNDIDTEDMILYPENIACEIACRIKAEKLVFLSEYRGLTENGNILPIAVLSQAKDYLNKNTVDKSCERRIRNSIAAVEKGVERAHIIDGQIEHGLLLEFFSVKGIGTVIMKDHSKYYPHEKNSAL